MTPQETQPHEASSTTSPAQSAPSSGTGPGETTVNTVGVILISAYAVLLIFMSLYLLIKLWPHCSPIAVVAAAAPSSAPTDTPPQPPSVSGAPGLPSSQQSQAGASPLTAAEPQCKNPEWVEFFWGRGYWIWDEVRLLLIVMIAGGLGALLHVIRSLFWYVGHRDLRWSWILMYVLLPLAGVLLAVAFYLVIRGGFFPQAKVDQSSPSAFAALSFLIGLFSAQAGLKLKQVFETIFSVVPPGANAKPQTPGTPTPGTPVASAPMISSISPDRGSTAGDTSVMISGANFSEGAAVFFGAFPAKAVTRVDASTITAVTASASAGKVDVKVANKDVQSATLPQAYTYEE